MLNSGEEASSTDCYCLFSLHFTTKVHGVFFFFKQYFYHLIFVGSQEGWQKPALFGELLRDLLYLKQGLATHQPFRVTLLSLSFVLLYLGYKALSFQVAFLSSCFLGDSSHSTTVLSPSHPTSCSPSLLKPSLPQCPPYFPLDCVLLFPIL